MTTETPARPSKFADYTLTRLLGEGNQGRVFAAKAPPRLRVGDMAALKIWRDRPEPHQFRLAAQELQYVRCLQSPWNVTVYEAGQGKDGTMYCAMEYAAEGSLAAPVRTLRRADVLRAVADAARGAHTLHEAGIFHGAVRPGNILLEAGRATLAEPDLLPLLCPGRSFHALYPASVIQYVDPALIRGAAPSRASDVWALGVTLHAALSGKPIYYHVGPDLVQALRTALTSTPIIDWSLTPEEAELVGSCLATEPGERPPTALEVAERIDSILGVGNETAQQVGGTVDGAEPATSGPPGFEVVPSWIAELPAPRDMVARAQRMGDDVPTVTGILCKRGHFNYPLASYCVSCGISLLQGSRRPAWRPRPRLGVLVLDDARICNLDTDYIIGREPSRDNAVQAGLAQPLRLDDQQHLVSAVHAAIHLDGWRVLLTDRGSATGTAIRPAGSQDWTRLQAGQAIELHSRTMVRIGEREFVFSSNRER